MPSARIYVVFQKTVIPSMGLSLPFLPDTAAARRAAEGRVPQLTATGRSRDRRDIVVTVGAKRSFRRLWIADSEFMRIFGLLPGADEGGAATAARRLLLTPAAATELFGHTDIVGETVSISDLGDVEVAGLLRG